MRRAKPSRRFKVQRLESRLVLDGAPTPLGNGQEVTREVGEEDPFDEFFFDVEAGAQVWVAVREISAKPDTQVDLDVFGPQGGEWGVGGPNHGFADFVAPVSGRYRAFVSERGNEQDFDYKIRFISSDRPLEFTYEQDATLSSGQPHVTSIGAGELSAVTFDAVAGSTVFYSLGKRGGAGTPRAWIMSPDGDPIA